MENNILEIYKELLEKDINILYGFIYGFCCSISDTEIKKSILNSYRDIILRINSNENKELLVKEVFDHPRDLYSLYLLLCCLFYTKENENRNE